MKTFRVIQADEMSILMTGRLEINLLMIGFSQIKLGDGPPNNVLVKKTRFVIH